MMRLQGKHNADVTDFHVKRNNSNDGQVATIDLEISVSEADAAEKFGSDFSDLAFSTMRVVEAEDDDGTDSIGFLQDSIKPGKRVVMEHHVIDVDGEEVNAQPQLLAIRTVDGERRVVAKIRIPVDSQKLDLRSRLQAKVNKTLKIEFTPQQAQFEFTAARDAGNGQEEAAAPAH